MVGHYYTNDLAKIFILSPTSPNSFKTLVPNAFENFFEKLLSNK